jgi:hypothetical protein
VKQVSVNSINSIRNIEVLLEKMKRDLITRGGGGDTSVGIPLLRPYKL